MAKEPILLAGSQCGVYAAMQAVSSIQKNQFLIDKSNGSKELQEILDDIMKGPDDDGYWDAVDDFEQKVLIVDTDGDLFRIQFFEGDLWAIPENSYFNDNGEIVNAFSEEDDTVLEDVEYEYINEDGSVGVRVFQIENVLPKQVVLYKDDVFYIKDIYSDSKKVINQICSRYRLIIAKDNCVMVYNQFGDTIDMTKAIARIYGDGAVEIL